MAIPKRPPAAYRTIDGTAYAIPATWPNDCRRTFPCGARQHVHQHRRRKVFAKRFRKLLSASRRRRCYGVRASRSQMGRGLTALIEAVTAPTIRRSAPRLQISRLQATAHDCPRLRDARHASASSDIAAEWTSRAPRSQPRRPRADRVRLARPRAGRGPGPSCPSTQITHTPKDSHATGHPSSDKAPRRLDALIIVPVLAACMLAPGARHGARCPSDRGG